MANVHRLIFAAFLLLLAWLPTSSYAYAATATTSVIYGEYGYPSCDSASIVTSGVCLIKLYHAYTGALTGCAAAGSSVVCRNPYSAAGADWSASVSANPGPTTYSCGSGATLSGAVCTCSAGFTESGSSCTNTGAIADAATLAALESAGCMATAQTAPSLSVCIGGRGFRGTLAAGGKPGFGASTCGPWSATGSDCVAGASTAPPGPYGGSVGDATKCPAGQSPGTVNGLTVCAASGTTVIASGKSASVAPGAPGGAVPSLGPSAPPSAVSSSDSIACSGAACTTTTSYKDGSGAVVGTSATSDTQASFCAQNPGLSICKTSSFGASACG